MGAVSWNQKFLDYEIETRIAESPPKQFDNRFSWNQKFLDYEIETQ